MPRAVPPRAENKDMLEAVLAAALQAVRYKPLGPRASENFGTHLILPSDCPNN